MEVKYNVSGDRRKQLVRAISEVLDIPAHYNGAPTFSYAVDYYTIDKNGTLSFSDRTDSEEVENLLDGLAERGFECEPVTCESGLGVMDAVDYPDIDQHHPGQYADPSEPLTEGMLCQAKAWTEGQPAFENLELTEREELGLGQENREDWQGENGMQTSDAPEFQYRTYQAELSDPDCPDRMECFGAANDEDAIQQAYMYATGDVVLRELLELDDEYNIIRTVDLELATTQLVIEMPLTGFTPEKLDNLAKLVNAKAPLLKAALGTDDLPIQQTADTLKFPWFGDGLNPDTIKAYSTLIGMLCATAKEKKRVTAKEKAVEGSPKYAMRCFLLSLGFIGEEYRTSRKILLSKLDGNSSWKHKQTYTAHCYIYPNGSEEDAMDATVEEFTSLAKAKAHVDTFAANTEGIYFAGAHVEDEKGNYVYELLCG